MYISLHVSAYDGKTSYFFFFFLCQILVNAF